MVPYSMASDDDHVCPVAVTTARRAWLSPTWRITGNYGGVAALRFVRVGTLDDPEALRPDVHIYTRSKLSGVALPAGVPTFKAYYDSKALWPAASLERRRRGSPLSGGGRGVVLYR
jgi:hypothetical protein